MTKFFTAPSAPCSPPEQEEKLSAAFFLFQFCFLHLTDQGSSLDGLCATCTNAWGARSHTEERLRFYLLLESRQPRFLLTQWKIERLIGAAKCNKVILWALRHVLWPIWQLLNKIPCPRMFICVNNLWLFIHILWIYFFFFQNCIKHPLWYKIQLVKEKKIIMLHAKWEDPLRI